MESARLPACRRAGGGGVARAVSMRRHSRRAHQCTFSLYLERSSLLLGGVSSRAQYQRQAKAAGK